MKTPDQIKKIETALKKAGQEEKIFTPKGDWQQNLMREIRKTGSLKKLKQEKPGLENLAWRLGLSTFACSFFFCLLYLFNNGYLLENEIQNMLLTDTTGTVIFNLFGI